MKLILEITGIACFAVLFAEASGAVQWLKKTLYLKRLKPLDCPMCLSWWMGLIYFGVTLKSPDCILYAAICSILAIIISKYIRN